jgi:hypothetical protein
MHKCAIKEKHGCNQHGVECGGQDGMDAYWEFKFEKDVIKRIGKEDVIGNDGHRECQQMTEHT